jgi:DNA-binding beta-propeller fold protein YncE
MRDRRQVARSWMAGVMVAVAVAGCGTPPGRVFPPPAKPIVWPPPPERARIRYVGQLSTSADLKPGVPITQGIGEMLFGKAAVYSMLTPYALCTDEGDRLFVADSNAQVVHVFNLKSRRYARWTPANREKRFAQPVGIAYDPTGRLFVADSVAGRIYEFDGRGRQTGEIGAGVVVRPCGLAFDPRRRQLFVADAGAHRVFVFSNRGELVTRIGSRGIGLGQFNFPTNVAVDGRAMLYVSDSLNFRIQQYSPQLQPLRQIGRKGDMPGYFAQPKGVAVDTQGHVYAVDANFETVQVFNDQGALLMDFGQEGQQPGSFWLPAGIFIDRRNRIWVADCYNRRVQVFDFLPEGRP